MNRFRDRFSQFMQGRYGTDGFNRFLTFVIIAILIVNIFVKKMPLTIIALLLIVYSYYRSFSRNYSARTAEEQRFQQIKGRFLAFFKNLKLTFTDRDHRYFACPTCGRRLRVPKGKGRISIRCPHCQTTFTKRT